MIFRVGFFTIDYLKKLSSILIQSEKRLLYTWFLVQAFLILFDLTAIILAALTASAFVPIIQSHPENIPKIVDSLYSIVGLDISIFKFLFILAGISGVLVLTRSMLSVMIENHFYMKLQFITERLLKKIMETHFKLPFEKRARISEVQTYIAVHESLNSLTIYVLGNLILISAEIATLSVLLFALLVWKPLVTSILLIILSISTLTSFKYHVRRSRKLSKSFTEINVQTTHDFFKLQKLESDYRLRNSFSEALDEYLSSRRNLSAAVAHRQVQFGVPRLILESSIVIGGLVSGVVIWYFMNISQGLVVLATFMVIGLRVQPSLSKIQNGIQVFAQHRESSNEALNLLILYSDNIEENNRYFEVPSVENIENECLEVINLKYSFQDGGSLFNGLNFSFPKTGIYLLRGKNGVGKTTLLEVFCGLRRPSFGSIKLNGQNLSEASLVEISKVLVYLPQKPSFVNQTIIDSLLLERHLVEKNGARLIRSVEILTELNFNLEKYSLSEEYDLDSLLSEGEKQKIGLARTLSKKQKLILLDEPTSSLDHAAMVNLKQLLMDEFSDCLILISCHDEFFDDVSVGEVWI